MSFADLKAEARRAVHTALSVPALYTGPEEGALTAALNVRWHNRLDRAGIGDLGNSGYATVLEGINRIVFDVDELDTLGLHLAHRGNVTLVKYGLTFRLDSREPPDGPVTEVWSVIPG